MLIDKIYRFRKRDDINEHIDSRKVLINKSNDDIMKEKYVHSLMSLFPAQNVTNNTEIVLYVLN